MRKDDEIQVTYSDQVVEFLKANPEAGEVLREFAANTRQAMQGVKDGRYKTFDDAMESITGTRPVPVDAEDLPDHVRAQFPDC